jgi:hypothetical protein
MNTCGSKKVYYTKTQALKHAREEEFRLKHRMFIYDCKTCGNFHLSSHKYPLKVYEIKCAGIKFLNE